MSKLKRFNKSNKKNIMPLVALCSVVAVVSATISYAVYQKEDEILFINARVGEFETSSSDIELAMTLDGKDVDVPPSKGDYIVTVECDNAIGRWDKEEWTAVIGNITSNRVKCNVNFKTPEPTLSEVTATSTKTSINLGYTIEGIETKTICKYGTEEGNYINNVDNVTNTNCSITDLELDTMYYYQVCAINGGGETCKEGSMKTKGKTLSENVELGDYISMTPTSTSYTISSSLTGYTSNQTINPSELNLWRVIRKNEDGTVEAVSDQVSSTKVYIPSYYKFVKALNTIAAQYTDGKHIERTRHIGYSNQTEDISNVGSLSGVPWSKPTSAYNLWTGCNTSSYLCGKNEPLGAGDIGYITDYNLVGAVYGTMISKNPSNEATKYWLASRMFSTVTSTRSGYYGRLVLADGGLNVFCLGDLGFSGIDGDGRYAVRPIVTFDSNSGIEYGDGTSVSPYTLD